MDGDDPTLGYMPNPTQPSRNRAVLLSVGFWMGLSLFRPAHAAADEEAPAEELDLTEVPGPWENHVVDLPDRVVVGGKAAPLTMHYLAAGPQDAPRVVLLHGFPDFCLSWRDVFPLLATDHRVIAPDMRGYAGTDKPADGYDLPTLAGDIVALIDATATPDSPNPVHLVGHDWGAAVAWAVAIEAPDRLATLTAISVPHPAVMDEMLRTSPEQRRRSRYMKTLASKPAPKIFARFSPTRRAKLYRRNLLRSDGLDDEVLAWYHAAFDSPAETLGPLTYYRVLLEQRRAAAGEPIDPGPATLPTLVLWGEEDSALMWEMARMSCGHVDALCVQGVFPEVGHFVQWEVPLGVADLWRDFLRDVEVGQRD